MAFAKELVTNKIKGSNILRLWCQCCDQILHNPVHWKSWNSNYCEECYLRFINECNTCPKIWTEPVKAEINKTISKNLSQLILEWKNKFNGCHKSLKYNEIEAHLKDCPFEVVSCPSVTKCEAKLLRKNLDFHTSRCKYILVKCEYCGHYPII